MPPSHLSLKLNYQGEIHRFRVEYDSLSLAMVKTYFINTFSMPKSFYLQYQDNERDAVLLYSENEFTEACHVFLELYGGTRAMYFAAYDSHPFRDRLASLKNKFDQVTVDFSEQSRAVSTSEPVQKFISFTETLRRQIQQIVQPHSRIAVAHAPELLPIKQKIVLTQNIAA